MPAILDARGQPIEKRTLAEPQTAALSWLQREIANHPSRGLTPSRLNSLLRAAELGDIMGQQELFTDMQERDAHIFAEMGKRRGAILKHPWSLKPPEDASAAEQAAAKKVEAIIKGLPDFEDVLLDMMDAVGKGFACLELAPWEYSDGVLAPAKIELQPQTWFQMDRDTRREIRLRDNSADGAALQPFGWITHVHKAMSGYVTNAALYRVLTWPYLFKNFAVRDLAEFLEIFGLPIRVGKYPTGASEAEKNSLLRAVVGIGHNAGGIIPMGMELEFQEAAKGNEVPFKAMIELCERSVSKAVLGATLTSSEGSHGTQALGNVHRDVQLDIEKSDARQLSATLTRDLVYPLYTLNVGAISMRRCPKFVFEVEEPEDIALMAEALPKLAQAGMKIETDWAHEKLGIPVAEDGKDTLKGPPPPAAPGAQGAAVQPPRPGQTPAPSAGPAPAPAPTQRQAAKAGAASPDRDAIDALIDEALTQFDPASMITPIEATLQRAIERGLTPEQFRVLLPKLISQVPLDALTETLAQAGFEARLAGEADLDLNR